MENKTNAEQNHLTMTCKCCGKTIDHEKVVVTKDVLVLDHESYAKSNGTTGTRSAIRGIARVTLCAECLPVLFRKVSKIQLLQMAAAAPVLGLLSYVLFLHAAQSNSTLWNMMAIMMAFIAVLMVAAFIQQAILRPMKVSRAQKEGDFSGLSLYELDNTAIRHIKLDDVLVNWSAVFLAFQSANMDNFTVEDARNHPLIHAMIPPVASPKTRSFDAVGAVSKMDSRTVEMIKSLYAAELLARESTDA